MKYEQLYDDFIAMFPEDNDFFRKLEEETGADKGDGMHVVFGMIVVPYIQKVVLESPDKAKRVFDFLEEMEKSGNPEIAEVAEFSVLEKLLTEDKTMVEKYAEFFGEETKTAAAAVGKWFQS